MHRLVGLGAFVVEDEALIALATAQLLEGWGCRILGMAPTAEAAIARAPAAAPDFVLMDVRLKGAKSGIDAAEELRAGGATFPIIFVTAYSQQDANERMRQIDRSLVLTKPVEPGRLAAAIRLLTRPESSG